MRKTTVAAIQMGCGSDVKENIEKASELIREAAAQGAQVILPPELFERPYFCQERRYEYYGYARTPEENDAVIHMKKLAKELETVIPVSFYEAGDHRQMFNSVAVIDADGSVRVADKGIKGIEAKAIRELLHRGECLCGTDLKEGSLAYKNVEKYIDYVPPKSIGTLVRDLKETISINRESNKEFVKKYEDAYREIQVLKKRLRDLDAEDRSILARISQIGEIDLGNAEEDLIRYKGYI